MSISLAVEVVPTGAVGAEVKGVDIAKATRSEVDAIKRAWYQHDVLVFRGQKLTDDDLLAFSRHFGTLDPPPNQGAGRRSPPGYPDIYVISNVRDEAGEPIGALGDGEAAWHTDMSYLARPPDASMLYSLEIPAAGIRRKPLCSWYPAEVAATGDRASEPYTKSSVTFEKSWRSPGILQLIVTEIVATRTAILRHNRIDLLQVLGFSKPRALQFGVDVAQDSC